MYIPVEIWEYILKTHSLYDLILLRSVSKYLHEVCKCIIRKEDEELFDPEDCLEYFAKNGFSSCLVWARQISYTWTSSLCATAAKYNHFDTLKILRANGCDWNAEVCEHAAANGNLEILKWAHENGCKFTQ